MLRQRADDLGLRVPNAQIARIIRAEPAFQTNGKFDMGRFNALLYQAQITEDAFSNSIRSDVLREMVTAGISEKMPAPGFMTDAMYRARHATRDIEFATIKFADFKVAANPTDEQLRETYAKNPKLVTEARKVSYVLVPAKINQPDSFEAGYKTAQALEDALIGGEPMDAAAKRLKAKFVSLPKLSADAPTTDAVLQIANVFEMEQGIESPILETKDGFAIVRVDEIIPEHNASFESVKKDLVAKWRVDEQKKQAYEVANQRLIKLNAGDALAGGKSATVGRANGAPTPVLAAAFGADVGTRTIVPGADAFYVLNVRAANAPKADAAKRTAIKTEADNMLNRAIADDYMGFLQREYPIKINQRIYKRLFGN
jgi:hypothetical protein